MHATRRCHARFASVQLQHLQDIAERSETLDDAVHNQVNGGLTKLLDAQPRNTAVVIIDDSYSFLPSGQIGARPLGGVTKNYHCRDEKPGRNGKSIARLRAVHPSFANQIHNVMFKPGFKTVRVAHKTHGIAINHYRLQAWEVQ